MSLCHLKTAVPNEEDGRFCVLRELVETTNARRIGRLHLKALISRSHG